MSARAVSSNPSMTRSVSFSDYLAFQSPPAFRRSRRLSNTSGRARPTNLFSSSAPSEPTTAPTEKRAARRSSRASGRSAAQSTSSAHHRNHRHHRAKHHRHRRHHHHHHHAHHAHHYRSDPDKENAAVAYAGSAPRKHAALRPLQEQPRNLQPTPKIKPERQAKKAPPFHCPHAHAHCCSRASQDSQGSLSWEHAALPTEHLVAAHEQDTQQKQLSEPMWPPAPSYNHAAQLKYSSQLQGHKNMPMTEVRGYVEDKLPFYPSLMTAREPVVPQMSRSEELGPLDRIAFIEQNGAKAHLHQFVMLHLQLPPDEGWEDMLHGLDSAQLHALYMLARKEPCGFALLRRAEAEESEVARLHDKMRKGFGKYAIARIVGNERRERRIALLSLKRFLESEGGRWTEENGVERAVIAMGDRIARLRDFQQVSL